MLPSLFPSFALFSLPTPPPLFAPATQANHGVIHSIFAIGLVTGPRSRGALPYLANTSMYRLNKLGACAFSGSWFLYRG